MQKLIVLLVVALSSVTLQAQWVWTEENIDPTTELRTGVIEVNGATYTIGPGASLRDADFSGSDLSYVNLRNANLSGANLSGADLYMADLSGTDLSPADLRGAVLTGADLSGADLSRAYVDNVYLGSLLTGVAKGNYDEIQALKPQVGTNTTEINELKTMMQAMSVQMQQLNARLDDQQASIEEKDQQIAELSQRPTLAEVQDARAGSLVFRADEETNSVTLEFEIQSSENLQDWVAQPETVTATVPLDAEKKFVRIALAQE